MINTPASNWGGPGFKSPCEVYYLDWRCGFCAKSFTKMPDNTWNQAMTFFPQMLSILLLLIILQFSDKLIWDAGIVVQWAPVKKYIRLRFLNDKLPPGWRNVNNLYRLNRLHNWTADIKFHSHQFCSIPTALSRNHNDLSAEFITTQYLIWFHEI